MSSSGDSDHDSNDCGSAAPQGEGPPQMTKGSRIIAAVVQNDVETLKSLLTSPKWYKVRDISGYDILEIAILERRKEVFDFLLSLKDYPLDAAEEDEMSALQLAVIESCPQYFVTELIKKGANVRRTFPFGDTLLHTSDNTNFNIEVAKLLILRGADVNAQNDSGETPLVKMLHQLYPNSVILLEAVSLLIYHGADVSKRNVHGHNALEVALRIFPNDNIVTIQENLLYLTIDEYSDYTLPFDIVLSIINAKSPLYCKIIDSIANIKFLPDEIHLDLNWYGEFLVAIDTEYLQVLMEKFGHVLSNFFLIYLEGPRRRLSHAVLVKNFQLLTETDLFFETLDVLSDLPLCSVIQYLGDNDVPPAIIIEICHYLLTYGFEVEESDLELVYKSYGYCELFKILLQMDIKSWRGGMRDIFPGVIYDVTIDLENFLKEPQNFTVFSLHSLLDYFANPELKCVCRGFNIECIQAKARRLPDVPLLVELARNASRKYLCKRFNITTSKWFYSMLNWLPINAVYKKIITFETKLYY